ncbi:polysaccharide deacetylase family protein [Anaerobacillus sp. HL2]|nr:polysaccharide deacetylase family protein [Anaerobacillus sp. HL2]
MELYPNIVAKTYEKGHMVLPHSYSHDYSIYTTFETFYKDLDKVEKTYYSVLGHKPPGFFRFPGGSSNQSSYKFGGKILAENLTFNIREKGYYYVDWNVICGDASSISKNPEEMLNQVINGSTNKNVVVALFHDVKRNKETARILPDVIDFYKQQLYLSDISRYYRWRIKSNGKYGYCK